MSFQAKSWRLSRRTRRLVVESFAIVQGTRLWISTARLCAIYHYCKDQADGKSHAQGYVKTEMLAACSSNPERCWHAPFVRVVPLLVGAALTAAVAAAGSLAAGNGPAALGSRLAFEAPAARGTGIAAIPAAGGPRRWIVKPVLPIGDPQPSPDGRWLAFTAGGVWIAPAHALAAATRIAPGADESGGVIAWSADGTRLAFPCSPSGVCVYTRASRSTRRILPGRGVTAVAWSRRGWLAVELGDTQRIGRARPDGSAFRVVATRAGAPTWSPDGTRIAFVRQGAEESVLVAAADGSGAVTVVPPADRSFTSLGWSPDGALIAGGGLYSDELDVFAPDGSGLRRLVDCGDECGSFAWEHDSRHLLYDRGFGAELHRVALDGTETTVSRSSDLGVPQASPDGRLLALDNGYVTDLRGRIVRRLDGTNPSWAPDGTRVALETPSGGIDILDLRSGAETPFLTDEGAADSSKYDPSWTPDGRRIAYDSCDDEATSCVHLRAVDGSSDRRLPLVTHEPLAWSPDGRRVAFVRWRTCGKAVCSDLYVALRARLGTQLLLVRNARDPAWSPDGRSIAFTALGPVRHVARIPAGGGRVQLLATGRHPTWIR